MAIIVPEIHDSFRVVVKGYAPDVTVGKTYTIVGLDWDGEAYFIDDAGDRNFSASISPGCIPGYLLQKPGQIEIVEGV